LKIAAWPRELTPSSELRKWYGHEPARFAEFRRRYRAELAGHADELRALRRMVRGRAATLITATREVDFSHAEVLRRILQRKQNRASTHKSDAEAVARVRFTVECVAKLSLKLSLARDSVFLEAVIRLGAAHDGAAEGRARSVLLFV